MRSLYISEEARSEVFLVEALSIIIPALSDNSSSLKYEMNKMASTTGLVGTCATAMGPRNNIVAVIAGQI